MCREQRGDLLFLTMPRKAPLKLGDITVYKVPGAPIPIVHRVIETHDEWVEFQFKCVCVQRTDATGRAGRRRVNSGF